MNELLFKVYHISISANCQLTRTLSKWIAAVVEDRIPNLSSFFPTENPGMSFSTMKHVIPLYPCERKVVFKVYLLAQPSSYQRNRIPSQVQHSP